MCLGGGDYTGGYYVITPTHRVFAVDTHTLPHGNSNSIIAFITFQCLIRDNNYTITVHSLTSNFFPNSRPGNMRHRWSRRIASLLALAAIFAVVTLFASKVDRPEEYNHLISRTRMNTTHILRENRRYAGDPGKPERFLLPLKYAP